MLTHGELFAGISGFGLGFDRAGMHTIWHVEIDRHCQDVLHYHYPDALVLSDIRKCGVHNLPHVDVISFGSPCQDMSVAGKRKGINGERSGLFFEAIRIIRELRPTFAIWENVPGALSSNGGRDFGAALDALAESGALDIAWRVLDAQWFGLAQRRKRVFVVCDFGAERAAEILSIPEGSPWDSAPSRATGARLATDVAASLRSTGDIHRGWNTDAETGLVAPTLNSGGHEGGFRTEPGAHLIAATLPASGAGTSRTGNERTEAELLVAFDTAQITSWCNRTRVEPGLPASTLNQAGQMHVAFTQNQRDELRDLEDCAGALAGEPGTHQQNYIAFQPRYYTRDNKTGGAPDDTADITNSHKAGDSATHVLVNTFGIQQDATDKIGNDVMPTLRSKETETRLNAVAFETRYARNGRGAPSEVVPPLKAESGQTGKGDGAPVAAGHFGVRRLTPTECERLQGVPDGWTAVVGQKAIYSTPTDLGDEAEIIGYEDIIQSDSVRYRQLGNAVAVPVATWIGKRIVKLMENTNGH